LIAIGFDIIGNLIQNNIFVISHFVNFIHAIIKQHSFHQILKQWMNNMYLSRGWSYKNTAKKCLKFLFKIA